MAKNNKDYKKHIFKYSNGATLVYAHNPLSKTTQMHCGFRCGAQCDGEYAGLSHLLEHMLFNGANKQIRARNNELFTLTDTYSNAFTSIDCICVHFDCPSVNLSTIMQAHSEILFTKTFDKHMLENEKKVVLHELDLYNDEEIIGQLSREFQRDFFLETALPRIKKEYNYLPQQIIGEQETLSQITPEMLTEYSDKYFVSENMVISVVSSLPFDQIKEMCDKYFISKVVSKPENKVEPKSIENYHYIKNHKMGIVNRQYADECQFNLLFRSPKYTQNKLILYSFLNDFIFNSRLLNENLRYKTGLTYSSEEESSVSNNHIYSVINFATDPEHGIEALKIVTRKLGELVEKGITQDELDKFKLYMSSKFERTRTSVCSSRDLFLKIVAKKEPFSKLKLDYENLTLKEVNDYLKNLYGMSKVCLSIDGNLYRLQHTYTEEEVNEIVFDIFDEPLTVPEEVLNQRVDDFVAEANKSFILVPSINEILADFNLEKRILKQIEEQSLVKVASKEDFSKKYRKLPKANLEVKENENEELTE